MDEIFKNNLELITEQLKISNQFYLDQLKTKDDEIKRLKEELKNSIDLQGYEGYQVEYKKLEKENTKLKEENYAIKGRYVDIPQDCSIVKNSVVLDLQDENTLLRNNQDEISTLYEIIGEKVGNTNLPRFTQQVAIELDKLVEEKERYFNWYDKGEKENTELKEKVKSYEDNVEEVGMTMIEKLTEESGMKECRIIHCEKQIKDLQKELKTHKFMWDDLLKEYIKVSMSSDTPIYDESLCLMRDACSIMGEAEQQFMIKCIKERIDMMNHNDWNEDGGVCKLTLTESHRIPSNYVNDRFMVYIETEVEGFSDDSDSSDDDSSDDDEPFATPTPQGNSN